MAIAAHPIRSPRSLPRGHYSPDLKILDMAVVGSVQADGNEQVKRWRPRSRRFVAENSRGGPMKRQIHCAASIEIIASVERATIPARAAASPRGSAHLHRSVMSWALPIMPVHTPARLRYRSLVLRNVYSRPLAHSRSSTDSGWPESMTARSDGNQRGGFGAKQIDIAPANHLLHRLAEEFWRRAG